jgi:hypothetical protein
MPLSERERVKSPSLKTKISPFDLPLALPGTVSPTSKGMMQVLNEDSINQFVSKRRMSIQRRIDCQKSLLESLANEGSISPQTCLHKLQEVENWYAHETASLEASKHELLRGMQVFKDTLRNIENDMKASDLITSTKDHRQALEMLDTLTSEPQLRTPVALKSPKDQIHISN